MLDFDSYFDSLVESYNSIVEVKWVDKGNELMGFFKVNDKIYQIHCINKGNDVWTYKFYHYKDEINELTPELTGFDTGKLSVLSTIRKGMDYLIKTKNPKALVFGANDKSESRKKLYWGYANEIEDVYKYTLKTTRCSNEQLFVLYKDINGDVLSNIIDKIIDEYEG